MRNIVIVLIIIVCPPSVDENATMANIIPCVSHLFKFTRGIALFARSSGGNEFCLLKCVDSKVRIVIIHLNDTKNNETIYKHAVVHRASPITNVNKPHIGALIDNRVGEPILLIQTYDIRDAKTARKVFMKYFGITEPHIHVRITEIFEVELK